MSWKNRYKKASFRGVKFYTESSDYEVGRRVVFYDLPLDESGASVARDMGRLPRRPSVSAILVGDNYDKARDALIAALEKPGPGELVHPYYGKLQVVIDGPARVRETTAEGGVAHIEFTFRKYLDLSTPSAGLDTLSSVLNAVDDANEALNSDFVGSFSVDGVQGFVRSANLDALENLTDGIQSINKDIDKLLSVPGNIASDLDEFSKALADLINTPQKLINTIQEFVADVLSSIDRVMDSIGALFPVSKKASTLGSTIESVPAIATPARDKQRVNQNALIRAVKGSMLVGVAKVSATLAQTNAQTVQTAQPTIVQTSAQRALALRDLLVTQFNTFAESDEMDSQSAIDDSVSPTSLVSGDGPQLELVHERMRALRVALVQHLTNVAGELPTVTSYIPQETEPAIVIAYRLYQRADSDLDIEARNLDEINHPSFVPGGLAIEVISNV